ncbi:UDP-2,3-diacylglucosamine diphosphatase [Rhodospirillaceae bacterium RKSG073]|nr:UDP-2,3-diacylglucosamine diphosphatase [Curvivirga aplysinae]MTI11461.1 UDP-2,3-diacylglucosamine diphosphatase [Curvivirga aplysinae]
MNTPRVTKYRSIWISDIHLGTKGCQADKLLSFLKHNESDYLYLVGDIIDGWRLKRSWYWPQSHNDVVQKILRKVRKGTKVIYVPGNHDEFAREYVNHHFGGVDVQERAFHKTADGKELLVIHGDEFDVVVRYAKWLALLGDGIYTMLLVINNWYNKIREKMGRPYWSLSQYLKLKVKNAVQFIAEYEEAIAKAAKNAKVDGVVCGHIHHPEMRDIDGILYCNDGDWVESCSALVEHMDGRLELVEWTSTEPVFIKSEETEASCAY